MKMLFLFIILILFINTCSKKELDNKHQQTPKHIDTFISERTSYKEVGDIKDLSYANIKRIEALISIPRGRTEEEIRATLQKAATEIAAREKPNALVVKGFGEGDKYRHGTFTAGDAIYAPNGRWEDASTSAPMSISVRLGSLYFQDNKTSIFPQKNDKIILVSKNNKLIKISKNRDSWVDEDIIAKVAPGKKAIVIERYEEAISPYDKFVRYLILVDNIKGWVDPKDISIIP